MRRSRGTGFEAAAFCLGSVHLFGGQAVRSGFGGAGGAAVAQVVEDHRGHQGPQEIVDHLGAIFADVNRVEPEFLVEVFLERETCAARAGASTPCPASWLIVSSATMPRLRWSWLPPCTGRPARARAQAMAHGPCCYPAGARTRLRSSPAAAPSRCGSPAPEFRHVAHSSPVPSPAPREKTAHFAQCLVFR